MAPDYQNDYRALLSQFDINQEALPVTLPGHGKFEIKTFEFESTAAWVHAGADARPDALFGEADGLVRENTSFRVPLFVPEGVRRSERFILLLHGLNEGKWDKYLPWAMALSERCHRPVILFPTAFHMNRAPAAWRDARKMKPLADKRKEGGDGCEAVSFLNAAISHRLQTAPQRFLASGLHTYYDILQLLEELKTEAVPCISGEAVPDIFAYSIGAFLAEILMVSNPNNYFESSRLFMFCGGGTLDSSRPVAKTILDSSAHDALFNWFRELFKTIGGASRKVAGLWRPESPEVCAFKSFLFHDRMTASRDAALKKVGSRIQSLSLVKDRVFPPEAIEKTLSGKILNSLTLDFGYAYKHEEPFPMLKNHQTAINDGFNEIFAMASDFFRRDASGEKPACP